jgi:wobble nucleotide-excising tRNase
MFEGWISMIESMSLVNAPCFDRDGVELGPLSRFNFIFGGNGSGKTTVSRAFAEPSQYRGTDIRWGGSGQSQTIRVYNRDYVQTTFGDADADLPGVFLLGTASREVHDEIAEIEAGLDEFKSQREALATTLGNKSTGTGKLGLIAQIRTNLTEAAWGKRGTVPDSLQVMFDGFRASKVVFLDQLLRVAADNPTSDENLQTVEQEAVSVLDETSTSVDLLTTIELPEVETIGGYELFGQSVIGSADVSLAPLINELRNSDWVQQGRRFLTVVPGKCPFCQQATPHDLAEQLAEYFDARYAGQLDAIREFSSEFNSLIEMVGNHLDAIENREASQLDVEAFRLARAALRAISDENQRRVDSKLAQASLATEIVDTSDEVSALNNLIDEANERIVLHNQLVANRSQARVALLARCWAAFARGTVGSDLAVYEARLPGEEAARDNLQTKIDDIDARSVELRRRLRQLQGQITSSLPIISDMNRLLESVGFKSFHLAESQSLSDAYELVREDGSRVGDTLSEGERTFITFLYFYHQLHGVQTDQSETSELVVVIDDPISSLDSDVLFVVSTLVRRIVTQVRLGEGRVRQLLVLTHNVHFHKEITYLRHGDSDASRQFFVVRRRPNMPSEIVSYGAQDPVRTVYKGLWQEIARAQASPDEASVSLQNVMRRVLENYFRIMGSINDTDLLASFQGDQQAIGRSLLSWVNEGSHSIIDELDFAPSGLSTMAFLEVFGAIFEKSGHKAHYDMMMAP